MANEKLVNRENLKAFRQKLQEYLENGIIVPSKSLQAQSIQAVSTESGATQETPFIYQGTGTANGTDIVDTSPVGKHLEKQGNSVVVNQLVNTGDTEVSTISGHKYWTYINGTIAKVDSTGANIEINDASIDKVVDLTQWFGSNSAIPQDLLDNPENASRYGITSDLAYNTGTLTDTNGRYLECGGRNLYDGTHDIQAIPNATYYCYGTNITITYKDSGGNTISSETKTNTTFVAPSNCYTIGISGSGNITISLYYTTGDGYSEHYAYEQPKVYDTGTEVLKSALNIRDIKEPNGTINRLVGEKTFNGTESWSQSSSDTHVFYATFNSETFPYKVFTPKAFSNYYIFAGGTDSGYATFLSSDKSFLLYKTNSDIGSTVREIAFRDNSCSTVNEWVAKLTSNNVKIQFNLETPTIEQGTPFSENIEINDYGTMGWKDTNNAYVSIPQGCKIFYPADYVLFIDSLGQREDIEWDATKLVSTTDLVGYVKQTNETTKITKNFGSLVYNSNSPKAYKTGNIATINISCYNSSQTAVASGTTLFTLDSSIRPMLNISFSVAIGETIYKARLDTNGIITCAEPIPYDTAIHICLTYAVA